MDSPPFLPYPDPDLADEVVRLRRWRCDDLPCVEQASTDPRIPEGTTVPAVYTPAEGSAFIERQLGRQTNGDGLSLAIADAGTNEALGLAVLMARSAPATAEIGYWIVPAARRRGRATRAIGLLARWAIVGAGLVRIEARVMPDNVPSLRLLSSCGFVREGVLRQQYYSGGFHHDMVILSLVRADFGS